MIGVYEIETLKEQLVQDGNTAGTINHAILNDNSFEYFGDKYIVERYVRMVETPMVGASGAIFGVMAAFTILFPNTTFYLYFAVPVKAKYLVGAYLAYTVYKVFNPSEMDNVAHLAHLGGAIAGAVMVLYWQKKTVQIFGNMYQRRNLSEELKHQLNNGTMTNRIVIANVVVFLFIHTFLAIGRMSDQDLFPLIDVIFTLNTTWKEFLMMPWGVFTSIFTHFDLSHIFFNMIFLYFAGNMFERFLVRNYFLFTFLVVYYEVSEILNTTLFSSAYEPIMLLELQVL